MDGAPGTEGAASADRAVAPWRGVVVSVDGHRFSVTAQHARAVLARARVQPVPGGVLGMMAFEGRAIPAVAVAVTEQGAEAKAPELRAVEGALVCECEGQLLALCGVAIARSADGAASPPLALGRLFAGALELAVRGNGALREGREYPAALDQSSAEEAQE